MWCLCELCWSLDGECKPTVGRVQVATEEWSSCKSDTWHLALVEGYEGPWSFYKILETVWNIWFKNHSLLSLLSQSGNSLGLPGCVKVCYKACFSVSGDHHTTLGLVCDRFPETHSLQKRAKDLQWRQGAEFSWWSVSVVASLHPSLPQPGQRHYMGMCQNSDPEVPKNPWIREF